MPFPQRPMRVAGGHGRGRHLLSRGAPPPLADAVVYKRCALVDRHGRRRSLPARPALPALPALRVSFAFVAFPKQKAIFFLGAPTMANIQVAASQQENKSWLDRSLSLFTDVRAGEGATAVLMLVNIFLLLICYSVIKTVREPLILLGGGAEVRSYASAGQALLLMGFVPLYGWFASRVNRARLLVGVTLFFIVCIELFATAVAALV